MNPLAILGIFTKVSGAVTGIDFVAIGNVMKTIGTSIVKYWQYWLIGLLFAVNAFTGYELKVTRDHLKTEVAAHVKDITDFKNAQAEADKQAAAIRAALTKESKADANQADANYAVLLDKYRASLLRFSANHSGAGQAGRSQLPTTQGGNGPSPSTELPKTITITGDDAGICAVNTARLQSVHDWALSLPKDIK